MILMINHKLRNKAMYQLFLFRDSTFYICYLFLCDFQTIIEVHLLSRKNMNQTKFILNVFNEDYLLIFAL